MRCGSSIHVPDLGGSGARDGQTCYVSCTAGEPVARRRKPRLFSFAREVELSHYDDVVSDPGERAALEAVVDAFAAICQAHAVAPETLMPIARACRHPSMFVRGAGITRLTVLTHYFPEAIDVMEQLARDRDEELRVFATAALANTPEAVEHAARAFLTAQADARTQLALL